MYLLQVVSLYVRTNLMDVVVPKDSKAHERQGWLEEESIRCC